MAGKTSSQNQERIIFLVMIFIIVGLIISGYFLFVKKIKPELMSNVESNNESQFLFGNENNIKVTQSNYEEYIPETDATVIKLYFACKGEDKLLLEPRRVRQQTSVIAQAEQIVKETLSGTKDKDAKISIIPDGIGLRSLFYENATFILDMTSEFLKIEQLGASEEILIVYSIVNGLTELDNRARVKFLINGSEPITEFGHIDFTVPLTRVASLIK